MQLKSISVTITQKRKENAIFTQPVQAGIFPYGTPYQVNKVMGSINCITIKTTGTSKFKYFGGTF
jgi:hypothetical protein